MGNLLKHNTLHTLSRDNIIFMSWERPASKPKVNVSSFEEFQNQLLTRLDVFAFADNVDILPCSGVYGGQSENSAAIIWANMSTADMLSILDIAVSLGADLGQESVLLRHNNENILLDCSSGKVLASGYGVHTENAKGDHTVLNNVSFSLPLVWAKGNLT